MQKHLFMIVAHNEPELLGRIVRKLAAPNHYFYIHIDKKKDMKQFFHCVGDVPNVDWCGELQMNVNWGGIHRYYAR